MQTFSYHLLVYLYNRKTWLYMLLKIIYYKQKYRSNKNPSHSLFENIIALEKSTTSSPSHIENNTNIYNPESWGHIVIIRPEKNQAIWNVTITDHSNTRNTKTIYSILLNWTKIITWTAYAFFQAIICSACLRLFLLSSPIISWALSKLQGSFNSIKEKTWMGKF